MKKRQYLLILVLNSAFLVLSYGQKPYSILKNFDANNTPPAPDYAILKNWAAHPDLVDPADSVPVKSNLKNLQAVSRADVFFIHPTIFTYKPADHFEWNASVDDQVLNKKVDGTTILNQASVFNGSCRVFAPRYRQAHYSAFTTSNEQNAKASLDIAYEDVKTSFEYYLKNFNHNRPVIIAGHSQGTVHAKRLIKEFFDGQPLQKQLVEAYLIGIATSPKEFTHIYPSDSAGHTGGFVSWNTFLQGYYPPYYEKGLSTSFCVNPLSWKCDDTYVSRETNHGGVGLKFAFVKELADAQVSKGVLWIHKPYVKGRFFLKNKVWHYADYNLFWMSIRDNVALRLENYLKTIDK